MLCVKVVKELYGENGGLDRVGYLWPTPWACILASYFKLRSRGVDLESVMYKKVGNSALTKFWKDRWYGEIMATRFPRLFELDLNKDSSSADRRCNGNRNWDRRHEIQRGVEFQ